MVIQFFADFSLNPQKNHLSCKSYLSGKQSPWHWWWFTSIRKLKFHDHILCVDNDEPANIFALYEPSYGKRLPGRQQNSFSSQVGEWIDPNEHFSEDHIVGNAQDPAGWRCLTVDCSSVNRWWWWWWWWWWGNFLSLTSTQTQTATYLSHKIKNNNCPLPSLIGKSKSVQGHNNSSSQPKVML